MADRGINTVDQQSNRDAKIGGRCSCPLFSWAPTVLEADSVVVCHVYSATHQQDRMLVLATGTIFLLGNEAECDHKASSGGGGSDSTSTNWMRNFGHPE